MEPARKRKAPVRNAQDPDFDPAAHQDQEDDLPEEETAGDACYSDYDSDWSDADSDDLSGDSDAEKQDAAGTSSVQDDNLTSHKKERREVWQSLQEPWMKIGYFLELGDRFSIVERGDFYVVVRDPKQRPGYLGNKAKLLEENGFGYSERLHRWQKRISEGRHDLETWRPFGHSYEADKTFFKDEFDEFA